MGTDIHLRVERFDAEKNLWLAVEKTVPNWQDEPEANPRDRNYNLFAFLAGVRNGIGFAGVDRGNKVEPQFARRGLPQDLDTRKLRAYGSGIVGVDRLVTPEIDADEDDDSLEWLGDHSYTHATLEELLSAPWDMDFVSRGIVEIAEYERWKASGDPAPESWCGMVSGMGVVICSESDAMCQLVLEPKDRTATYVRAQWTWKPLVNCGFRRWLDTLLPIAEAAGGTQNVRVLIGFDS